MVSPRTGRPKSDNSKDTMLRVRIDDETVDVVVDKEELTDAEVAQIEDIVKRKTGFEADKIRISPLKKTN